MYTLAEVVTTLEKGDVLKSVIPRERNRARISVIQLQMLKLQAYHEDICEVAHRLRIED